ncbi:hypothetical protein ACJMK2_012197 [Sinanodonta woodiana]|uniref:17-beta-hydroxysteroid dehydrogenase 14 n=1 Tax=Sinanodonta woodiana TaxID=1069815 RepID=A0ABD3VAJ0_SINWO
MAAGGLRYKDKVTLVTGGSKGIGRGCVEVFVRNGSTVVFCSRGESEGKRLEEEVNANGPGQAFFIQCDMAKEEDCKNLVEKTVKLNGRIDCLINNAGTHPSHKPIDQFSGEDLRELLNINLVSFFLTSKYALPHLRKTQGNIINVSSVVNTLGQHYATTYVSTKGGISAFTRGLAIDEAKYGVRVNTISPGNIWTPLWDHLAKTTDNPNEAIERGKDSQLLGRFGTAEECGLACLFLAADATFCTGIDLNLTGGAELNYGVKNPSAISK